jgi:lipid II:glycine glycyltransferase (peptidoglycan interpeptide bridge formation enzyme)
MTTALVAASDPTQWDAFVSAASDGSILQSWAWGELKAQYGWEPVRYQWIRDGRVRGAISILRRPLPGGLAMHYAPRGPVLDNQFDEWPSIWPSLRRRLGLQAGTILKLDPEWPVGASHVLEESGARPGHAIQHEATALIDLRGGEDVFSRMSASARRNIRQAERAGVRVESRTEVDAVARFYELLKATADRQRFIVRSAGYYCALFEAFKGSSILYFANHQEATVAASLIVTYGTRLIYLFSGSSDEGRRLKAPYLIQQHAIRDGQALGCRTYDLWGIPVDFRPGDPGWGYAHFKEMLGGVPIKFAGAWDFPIHRPLAAAYHLAERMVARPMAVA